MHKLRVLAVLILLVCSNSRECALPLWLASLLGDTSFPVSTSHFQGCQRYASGQGSAVSEEDIWTSLAFSRPVLDDVKWIQGYWKLSCEHLLTKQFKHGNLGVATSKYSKGSTLKVSLPTSFGKKESSDECSWIHLFCRRRGLANGCHGTWPRRVQHPSTGRVPAVPEVGQSHHSLAEVQLQFDCSTENLKVTDFIRFIPFHDSKNCR